MPGLVPGIHVLLPSRKKDVDGRAKPGHDGVCCACRGMMAGALRDVLVRAARQLRKCFESFKPCAW
jgi:hypothetical protein